MHEDQRPVAFPGVCRDAAEQGLSEESAVSAHKAALAVVRHGIRYLPVVDDGILVVLVAVQWLSRCRHRAAAVVQDGDRSAASTRAPRGTGEPRLPRARSRQGT